MECECEEWIKNINLITSSFVLSSIRGWNGYTGKVFKFCPWCGTKLKESKYEPND